MPIAHLAFIWPHVRDFIASALAKGAGGRYEASDILDLLLQGKARLWVSWNAAQDEIDAAIVTETIQYPRLRELRVWLVGGKGRKNWFAEAENMLAQFAKAEGCKVIASGGRSGWLRVIGDKWRATGATWERAV